MGNFQDSVAAIVLYRSVVVVGIIVVTTILCGAAAALAMEFLEGTMRRLRRTIRQQVQRFLDVVRREAQA